MKKLSPEEQYQFSQYQKMAEDESDVIDLSLVVAALWRHRLALLVAILIGVGAALLAYMALPAKWQATATLQVGQMPANGTAREVKVIEPQAQLVEKFKLRGPEVLTRAGLDSAADAAKAAALLASTLKATAVKNTGLVQISASGYTPEEAKNNVSAAAAVVIDEHAALFQPGVQRLEEQLRDNALEIAEAEAGRREAQDLLKKMQGEKTSANFGPTIVAIQLADSKDATVRRLQAERVVLEDMAAPTSTFLTHVVNPVSAQSSPYFPNLKLFLALGIFLGGLGGIGFVFYREWQSNAAQPAPGSAA